MIKSSTLRCSLGSNHSSGLKAPAAPAPRGTTAAIWQARSATSNVSMRLNPHSPAIKRRQFMSTPQPNGDTRPRPVTTTLRMDHSRRRSFSSTKARFERAAASPPRRAPPQAGSGRLGCVKEFHGVADRQNGLGGVVRDFDAELLLERHHQFDDIERIRSQVVDEAGFIHNLLGLDAEVFDNNLLHALGDIAHFL